jgi:fatty acid synthase subunit alpha, fungi type
MKSIFPAAIDGDLLKLVHLSNSFRLLYHGRFVDYENTFDTNDADVGVLQSRNCLSSSALPLFSAIPGFKDKSAYHNVSVSGDTFVRKQLTFLIKVGSVDF